MQELKKQAALQTEKLTLKSVTVFIESTMLLLKGDWQWNLKSDSVFCSDVILSLPPAFEGTKAIIHPDDRSFLKEMIDEETGKINHLEFRIITTYGEVETLSCDAVVVEKPENSEDLQQSEILKQAADELAVQKEYESLQLQKEIYERSEKFTGTGIWYYNSATNETWYSANIFRIFSLPPLSLNAHLNTFNSFIHPEDREHVIEFTTKAFKQRAPLHMQYRVITTAGEKILLSATSWFFSTKGEQILSGSVQDVTEQRKWEESIDIANHSIGLMKQQLVMDEQHGSVAHWQVHLLTRKTVYSDNYYRIFGLRAQSIPAGVRNFINYIDPEDRDLVSNAHKRMIYEHVAPEIDFRITRSDGRVRYISQKAKLVTYGNEMVIVGIIQDVTVQKMLEKKLTELTEKGAVKTFTSHGMEEMAGIANWVWELNTGEIVWSENFYKLLGYKPNGVELNPKLLLAFVHPEDQKIFKNNQSLVLDQKQETEFEFRLVNRGSIKYMKASFRLMQNKEANFFIATLQDITKETLLQKQLQQRIQLAEALSENILDRVIITDISNNILSWNKECQRVYDVKKEAAIGANFFDVFPQLKTEDHLHLFNRVLKGEKINVQGNKLRGGNGFYDLQMTPLWDEDKTEITGIVHIFHDVTREYELRQSLHERLNFISSLLEASVDRIIALDHNMNYLYWNKKAEEYYGINKEEVVGRNILEIFPSVVNDPSYGEFRKVLKGDVVHVPAASAPGGLKDYFEIYLIPIRNEDEDVSGVLWIAHDLTREYQLQLSSAKERDVLEALNENYIEIDSDFRICYANQNALNFLAKQKMEVEGKPLLEILPVAENGAIYQAVTAGMAEGVSSRDEFYLDFSDTWLHASIAPTSHGVILTFFDVTSEKKAKKEIARTNEIMQLAMDSSNAGFGFLDHRTGISQWDGLGKRLIGFSSEEEASTAAGWLNRVHPDDREKLIEYSKQCAMEGKNFTMEYRVVHDSGAIRYILGTGYIKQNDAGEPLESYGLVIDITERKKSEKKLNETLSSLALQNKIYEQAEEIACLGTWTWNMDTNETKFSDNMFRLFGMEPQEVEPGFETILKFVHPDDRQELSGRASAIKEEIEPVSSEYRVIRKDGEERIFRNKEKLIRNENGERLLIGTAQDITEETKLKKQLKQSTQYAEKILDATINRIHAVDRNMTIIAWNKRTEEITGIKREDAIGKKLFDVLPKLNDDEIIRKAYEDAIAGNYVHLQPKPDIYAQGVYERFFIPLKNSSDKTTAVVTILLDVSTLIQKEEQLKELNRTLEEKNKELEQKNEEITSFAFVASHDLREPLRKIHTFSDWLLEKESANLQTRGKEYLIKINASVKRLNMLIDDILVLTKIHADTQKIDRVDLNAVWQTARTNLSKSINEKKELIETKKLPAIRGNKNQLTYLFSNLLDNAIKFQPKGQQPVISISSEVIEFSANSKLPLKEGKDYLKVSVADNGIGFDRKYKGRIFRVFQQLKQIEHEGSGMGLTICKKVMDNHDGFITAESEPGKGSIFCCYFPV